MEIQTLTDLTPAVVAIVVPWLTFRYALRREQRQWSREQRAQVYIDLLVEASAELDWLKSKIADAATGEEDRFPMRTTA